MISFLQYITEAGDNPYPFKEVQKSQHMGHPKSATYEFHVDDDKYFADLQHFTDSEAEASFGSKHDDPFISAYALRGDKGEKAARVMSTVHHIIKRHVSKNPELKTIDFTSDMFEPSRVSLYTRYTKKMGGETHGSSIDPTRYHRIPADSYRK